MIPGIERVHVAPYLLVVSVRSYSPASVQGDTSTSLLFRVGSVLLISGLAVSVVPYRMVAAFYVFLCCALFA